MLDAAVVLSFQGRDISDYFILLLGMVVMDRILQRSEQPYLNLLHDMQSLQHNPASNSPHARQLMAWYGLRESNRPCTRAPLKSRQPDGWVLAAARWHAGDRGQPAVSVAQLRPRARPRGEATGTASGTATGKGDIDLPCPRCSRDIARPQTMLP